MSLEAKRERVTISIKPELLKKVDSLTDGLTIRSRSQAFEFLLSRVLGEKINTALVLAGGNSKDISIAGKTKFLAAIEEKPLIETVLRHLNGLGVNNFVVYADFQSSEIIEHFNSVSLPFSVKFITGKKATGTAEPILKAKPFLKDTFLLAYGDTFCRLDLSNMYALHKNNSSISTIALATSPEPKKFGVASVEGSKIKGFEEKPKNPGSYFVNAGYFLMEPEILSYFSKKDKSLERDVLPRLARQGLLHAYPFQGLYLNVNKKADLEKARAML